MCVLSTPPDGATGDAAEIPVPLCEQRHTRSSAPKHVDASHLLTGLCVVGRQTAPLTRHVSYKPAALHDQRLVDGAYILSGGRKVL